jgi:hypothetical protein
LFRTLFTMFASAWMSFSQAQTGIVQLVCPWGGDFDSTLLTIDYDSRIMRMEAIDKAGNIGPPQGIVPESLQGLQSQFSDATISLDNRYWRFVLNRYSGVLQSVNKSQNYIVYTQPCTPYERPPARRY